MKHIRLYNDVTEQQNDFTRPILYAIKGSAITVCDADLTLVKSGTTIFKSKTSGSYTSHGHTYKYLYTTNSISNPISPEIIFAGCPNGKLAIKFNNGDLIVGTYEYNNPGQGVYSHTFYGADFYYYYYYKQPSGQGAASNQTFNIYSNTNFSLNTNIAYEIYTG